MPSSEFFTNHRLIFTDMGYFLQGEGREILEAQRALVHTQAVKPLWLLVEVLPSVEADLRDMFLYAAYLGVMLKSTSVTLYSPGREELADAGAQAELIKRQGHNLDELQIQQVREAFRHIEMAPEAQSPEQLIIGATAIQMYRELQP